MDPRIARIITVSLAFALAACHKEEQKPTPSIVQLSQALQSSADKNLTVPPLADAQVLLLVPPGGADARAAAVTKLAATAGGAALRGPAVSGSGVSVLASIPENNAEAFKASVKGQPAPMSSPAAGRLLLIEVDIEEQTVPSPSP
jgi:hypothetical protein